MLPYEVMKSTIENTSWIFNLWMYSGKCINQFIEENEEDLNTIMELTIKIEEKYKQEHKVNFNE